MACAVLVGYLLRQRCFVVVLTPKLLKAHSYSLDIVLPGISCSMDKAGPESEACSQMNFFTSRETAETWLKEHEGGTILTVEEAFQLARTIWIEPFAKALEAAPQATQS